MQHSWSVLHIFASSPPHTCTSDAIASTRKAKVKALVLDAMICFEHELRKAERFVGREPVGSCTRRCTQSPRTTAEHGPIMAPSMPDTPWCTYAAPFEQWPQRRKQLATGQPLMRQWKKATKIKHPLQAPHHPTAHCCPQQQRPRTSTPAWVTIAYLLQHQYSQGD